MATYDGFAAELQATQVLRNLEMTSLPVDPFAIAARKDIVCEQKPGMAVGISGCLMKVGDIFGILYSALSSSEGFQRFTVAHELGHYFLEGHVQHLFGAGQLIHHSESGFTSDDKYEREADSFAAGLLMPKLPFKAACTDAGQGLEAVEGLAALCGTSLTATAIRYASYCDDPVAVVCSQGQRVQFAFMSKPLKDRRDLTWIRKGAGLPMGTATAAFNKDPHNVLSAKRVSSSSTLDAWFDGGGEVELTEEVIGLGEYGRTLTVLSAESLPDPPEEDEKSEEDEDQNLLPSQRWRERG